MDSPDRPYVIMITIMRETPESPAEKKAMWMTDAGLERCSLMVEVKT